MVSPKILSWNFFTSQKSLEVLWKTIWILSPYHGSSFPLWLMCFSSISEIWSSWVFLQLLFFPLYMVSMYSEKYFCLDRTPFSITEGNIDPPIIYRILAYKTSLLIKMPSWIKGDAKKVDAHKKIRLNEIYGLGCRTIMLWNGEIEQNEYFTCTE